MQLSHQKISPFLWFDTQAEEAAEFYVSIFEDSRIVAISRYSEAGKERHGKEPGSAMVVSFELCGQKFSALNGGPQFKFSEAISFAVGCETQAEIDHYWSKLTEGGQESQCGWLKDRFGVSWQIVPSILPELLTGSDRDAANRVTQAFMQMKKFDIEALERAAKG